MYTVQHSTNVVKKVATFLGVYNDDNNLDNFMKSIVKLKEAVKFISKPIKVKEKTPKKIGFTSLADNTMNLL